MLAEEKLCKRTQQILELKNTKVHEKLMSIACNPTTWGWCRSTLSKSEASVRYGAEQYLKGSGKFPRGSQQQTSSDRWELFDEYEEQVIWNQVRGEKIRATEKGLKDTWTACCLHTWETSETGTRGTASRRQRCWLPPLMARRASITLNNGSVAELQSSLHLSHSKFEKWNR